MFAEGIRRQGPGATVPDLSAEARERLHVPFRPPAANARHRSLHRPRVNGKLSTSFYGLCKITRLDHIAGRHRKLSSGPDRLRRRQRPAVPDDSAVFPPFDRQEAIPPGLLFLCDHRDPGGRRSRHGCVPHPDERQ